MNPLTSAGVYGVALTVTGKETALLESPGRDRGVIDGPRRFPNQKWRGKMKDARVLSAREMSVVFRLSKPERFSATPEEKGLIDRFEAEGIVKVYPGEISTEVEVTKFGAECFFETLKVQNRLNIVSKGGMVPPHSSKEKEIR